MRIGILTFHCVNNCGAVLQAYALQEFLLQLGHDVYIIDYRPSYLLKTTKLNLKKYHFIRFGKDLVKFILNTKGRFNFADFRKRYFRLYALNFDSSNHSFDAFVFGSDQIWNKQIIGSDKIFWGNFLAADNIKLLSYAASCGGWNIADNDLSVLRRRLNAFTSISVREDFLAIALQRILNRNIDRVLDPTLLLDKSQFEKILVPPKVMKPYIFIYEVTPEIRTIDIAQQIVQQTNKAMQIIRCGAVNRQNGNLKTINNVGPLDFLGYIKNAFCIVTTSFHGTALSIAFNRNFYTIRISKSQDERVRSLLSMLDLDNRLIDKSSTCTYTDINYTNVNKILQKQKVKSEHFLRVGLQMK